MKAEGVKDLLAHLIGWDYTYLQAFQDVREGRLPEFFAHFNPDWRKYNAALVEKSGNCLKNIYDPCNSMTLVLTPKPLQRK